MPIYSSTTRMKEIILQEAKKLFYEQGYEETSIEQIANACDIIKGLVSYHYGSKSNIASAIDFEYFHNVKNLVASKFYDLCKDYDVQIGTAVEMRLTLQIYHDDMKVWKFHNYVSPYVLVEADREDLLRFWDIHYKKYSIPIDASIDEGMLIAESARGATERIISSYFKGVIRCDFEDFADYRIRVPFKLMKIDDEIIEDIVIRSKDIFKQMDFKILPYFVLE